MIEAAMTKAGWARISPFALFMVFVGIQQVADWGLEKGINLYQHKHLLYLYPLKIFLVAALLYSLRKYYSEIKFSDLKKMTSTIVSILLGLFVFVLWINMDWKFATFGKVTGFDPTLVESGLIRNLLILIRIAGAAILVPIMEELFWRSFMLRYIISSDFVAVRIGTYSLFSFLVCAVLFGLEHSLVLAGIMAGIAYSLVLYKTKSIAQCILCHGVTNLALGFYVLNTGSWTFW
jgi:CAAX prenyl protease-like protein